MAMAKTSVYTSLVCVLMGVTAYASFYVAPTVATMGLVQRIFYLHAPSGMTSLAAFLVSFVGSVTYILTRRPKWDWLAVSAAEVGVAFCTVVLLTGPIWAHPAGGVWWAWGAPLS